MHHRLVYGNYPELLQLKDNAKKEEYLREILGSYLLKDILAFENIRNADKIFDLLRLIAFQIGGEVSIQELGHQSDMSKNTVDKYLESVEISNGDIAPASHRERTGVEQYKNSIKRLIKQIHAKYLTLANRGSGGLNDDDGRDSLGTGR